MTFGIVYLIAQTSTRYCDRKYSITSLAGTFKYAATIGYIISAV